MRRAALLTAVIAFAAAGCAGTSAGGPDGTTGAADTRPLTSAGSDAPGTEQTAVVSSVLEELSPDDDLRINPPPPANVRVGEITSTSAELTWDEPPTVTVPHQYSDTPVGYRVYRGEISSDETDSSEADSSEDGSGDAADGELRPLAMSVERTYVDRAVESGRSYRYAVASVHEMNLEGTRSYPAVEITVP